MITVGAHAIGLATHATPAMGGEALTEAYLTQPAVTADVEWGPFQLAAMVNFEGLTLDRGELNAGVWGEGYVDRRHPHTYLHEAVLTYEMGVFGGRASLSAGRGFAPFGTDDPMVRPFVKYPSNHHLSQILERPLINGAIRGGPVILEAGLFTGVEPVNPEDMGDVDKIGDSWSARVTVLPRTWLELQGSYADVASPENPTGEGLDHEMWNVSARAERSFGAHQVYALVETGRTVETKGGFDYFEYNTFLAETAVGRGPWQLAVRFERSTRPEEERMPLDFFRAVRPHVDNSILGTTRWTSGSLNVSRSLAVDVWQFRPFVEINRFVADPTEEFPVFVPEQIYGSDTLWSFSFGIRSTVGMWHQRMGRYGAARVSTSEHHH